MNKANKEKLQDLLTQIAQLATKTKEQSLSIFIKGSYISVNNNYWELRKSKQIESFSTDRGKTWTDLFVDF